MLFVTGAVTRKPAGLWGRGQRQDRGRLYWEYYPKALCHDMAKATAPATWSSDGQGDDSGRDHGPGHTLSDSAFTECGRKPSGVQRKGPRGRRRGAGRERGPRRVVELQRPPWDFDRRAACLSQASERIGRKEATKEICHRLMELARTGR